MSAVLDAPAPVRAVPSRAPRALPPDRRLERLRRALLPLTLGAFLAGVHAAGLGSGPGYRDDEGTYVAQAWSLIHQGRLSHYTYWYDHPPLGWIVIAAWQMLTSGWLHASTAVEAGRQFMVVVATLNALLIYAVGRRLGLQRWAVALAVIGWGLSPLALSYSRMVYLDNIGLAFLLGALALALTPRKHLWVYAASGLCLSCALLSKETLLLAVPAVALAVWRGSAGQTRPYCVASFATTAVLVLALYPLFAVLRGELLPGASHVSLIAALKFQLVGRASTGSPLGPSSGSAALVGRWLSADPWLLGSGVLAAPVAVVIPRLRVAGLAVALPVLLSLRPGYLPDPFVIALLPFCALVVAGLIDAVVAEAAGRLRRRAVAQRVIGLAVVAAVLAMLVPGWLQQDRALAYDRAGTREVAAEQWIQAHVPHGKRILIDDTMWVDLVRRGFNPKLGVIWFYKVDFTNNLDPSVARALPDGYRDVDYVVSTPVMRSALDQQPQGLQQLRAAIHYSRELTTIGTGAQRIEVRKLVVPPGAPRLPNPARP
jgi:hypothetical protein